MNVGPAERERLISAFLLAAAAAAELDENLTFIESCLTQLLARGGLAWKFEASFSVELVRDDLRLGGAGGTTGTKDFTVFGNGPNMSSGREMFVIG